MADEEFSKLDETTIRVTKVLPVQFDYKLDYLVAQRAAIVAQKEKDNSQRDFEIAEVDGLIAKCKELGVSSEAELKEISDANTLSNN